MKKHIHKIWSVVLIALLCITAMPMVFSSTANATGIVIATANIPVSVTVSGEDGTLESDIPVETYTFKLTGLEEAPMPEEAETEDAENPGETKKVIWLDEDGNAYLSIEGEGNAYFSIDYTSVGVYKYTLTQDTSALSGDNSICNDRGNYDSIVYNIEVYVMNGENGGYDVVIAAYDSETNKKAETDFDNTYDPVPYVSLTVEKTWTDNDQTRPGSISVQLLDGDEIIETVTLSSENSWTYTWTGLDPYGEHDWNVQEVEISGYTAEYTVSEDGTVIIHNVGEKRQTEPTPVETETETETESETSKTTESESGTTTTEVQTGDTTNLEFYMALLILSAAAIAGVLLYVGRRRAH